MSDPYLTCAHCGTRNVTDGDNGEHMCLGFLFDWAAARDGERHEMIKLRELMSLMTELGV